MIEQPGERGSDYWEGCRGGAGLGMENEFGFGHVKFEMYVR